MERRKEGFYMNMKPLLSMTVAESVFGKTLGLYATRNVSKRVCDRSCF